jgi:predicted O-methyltransferase YrrM
LIEPSASAADRDGAFDAALQAVASVEGWMTDDQARRLWSRAAELRAPSQIVEIGSYRGRSAIVLARAADAGVDVVAIDPHAGNDRGPQQWDGEPEQGEQDNIAFRDNLERAGVADRVRHVRRSSQDAFDAVDGDVDLLYVDGSHRYRLARADIERWGARVRPGGTLLVHDSFSSIGVTFALLRLCVMGGGWEYVGRDTSLTEYRRRDMTPRARLGSAGRQLAQLPWFARNLGVKLAIVAHAWPLARLLGHRSRNWPY